MRVIVCAAIRAEDGSLLLGIRHYSQDMQDQLEQRGDREKFYHRGDDDQGFVDQYGVYLTRREAFIVARSANQINDYEACTGYELYSEGLY